MESERNPAETYEHYLGAPTPTLCTSMLLDYVRPRQGDRVLDRVAGTGSAARLVKSLGGVKGRIVALDINAAMLAVGRAVPALSRCPSSGANETR